MSIKKIKLDLTKPVRCYGKNAARILATNIKDAEYPVVAVITTPTGREKVMQYTADGKFLAEGSYHAYNLENIPEKKVMYLNVYKSGHAYYFPTEQDALDASADTLRGLIIRAHLVSFEVERYGF